MCLLSPLNPSELSDHVCFIKIQDTWDNAQRSTMNPGVPDPGSSPEIFGYFSGCASTLINEKKLHAGKEDLPPPYPLPKNAARKKACCSKPCSKVKLPQGSQHVWSRAGRVRELARSRSKFKLVWHQFSTVQLSIHHFVWKVHLFSSGHRGQVFSSFSSVQFTNCSGPDSDWPGWLGSVRARFSPSSLHLVGMSKGAALGPLQRKSQPAGPGFVACLFVCLFIRV